jgi:glucosamine-6-phosphate deaminase
MMKTSISENPRSLGIEAGKLAAAEIREVILQKGLARIILATGTSQFETLNQLVTENDIDWGKVLLFHLDEYIGLPITAAASFRKYLQERFLNRVGPLKAVYLIDGEGDAVAECKRLGSLISEAPIDLALVGIGENGHLAFNDPPADFITKEPFIVVELDEACRKQQLGEGWFASMEEVPRKAISMSIREIMRANKIICSVPDSRKAHALQRCLEGPVNNLFPASILQTHTDCTCFLDKDSAALLSTAIYS